MVQGCTQPIIAFADAAMASSGDRQDIPGIEHADSWALIMWCLEPSYGLCWKRYA